MYGLIQKITDVALLRCVGKLTCVAIQTVVVLMFIMVRPAAADEYFRFGTGGTGGTYLPIGSLIADAINKREIQTQGQKVVVLPQRSNGSVANLVDISENLLEAGLAQADAVSHVYQGKSVVAEETAKEKLRTVGALFLESVHLVVAADSGINNIGDLAGKRVSVDELGSGTQIDAEILMAAYGLQRDDVKTIYLKPGDSIDRIRRGTLDAFFVIAGYPLEGVKQLVVDGVGTVIGFTPDVVKELSDDYLYLSRHTIPAGVYMNTSDILTLSVPAEMIVRSDVDADTVYQITQTLWSSDTLQALEAGHPRGADIQSGKALQGIGIPLHDGALRYYREHGFVVE